MIHKHLPILGLLAALSSPAFASTTHQTLDDLVVDFASGDYTTSTLTQKGFLTPPIERERLARIDSEIGWDVVERGNSRYIATGHEGKLFKQQGTEDAEEFAGFKEPALYAIANDPKRGLVVAASPGGMLYGVDDKGTTSSLAQIPAEMIWDVLPVGKDLLVATGTPATLAIVAADGTVSTRATFKRPQNILDVATIPGSDDIVVATQGPGTVARVAPDGKVSILVDPQQEEVRRVAVGSEGSIYAAVNGVRSPGEKFLGRQPTGPTPPPSGNNKPRPESFIIRIHPDGFSEEWWTSPESPIHDLALQADGSLVVAAGMKGAVIGVTPDGDTLRYGVADETLVTRLVSAKDGGLLAVTGGEATLWKIDPARRADGEYVSKVIDALGSARWARVRSQLDAADGGVKLSYRTGNTLEVDDTWSEWSEPVDLAGGEANVSASASRFFQYKLLFSAAKGDAAQPSVDLVRVFRTAPNVAPRLTEVRSEPQKPKDPASAAAAKGKYDIVWDATDPNQDTLIADVYLAPVIGGSPSLIAENVEGGRYPLDSLALPDGKYRFEVEVSDSPSNPLGAEETARLASTVLLIDNTPPVFNAMKVEREKDSVTIRFSVLDASGLVSKADWRTGTKLARPLIPDDGVFDAPVESFTLTLTGEDAKPGTLVILSVGDENDNRSFRELILE